MDKYYAQEKRVFDINKVTVVGNPTITSDGVASGFSVSDYIDTNYSINTINSQNLNIDISFTTSSDVTTNQYILHSKTYAQLSVCIRNGQLRFGIGTNNAWIGDTIIGTVNNNTRYNLNLNFTTSGVTYTLKTNDTIITNFVANKTMLGDTQNMNLWLGVTRSSNTPFLGSIDLTAFKIYVDGELVYSPTKAAYALERRKPKVWNKGQFTIVGNPSISESGVASGFSGSSYIKKEITLTNNWGFVLPVKVTNETVTTQWISAFLSEANERICIIRKEGNYLYIQGFNGAVSSYAFTIPYVLNQTVYLKAVKNGNSLVLSYSNDLKNWIEKSFDLTGYTIPNVKNVNLGIVDSSWQAFLGSINLSSFSITVDGKEVFTGAKEKFYAMRGM